MCLNIQQTAICHMLCWSISQTAAEASCVEAIQKATYCNMGWVGAFHRQLFVLEHSTKAVCQVLCWSIPRTAAYQVLCWIYPKKAT